MSVTPIRGELEPPATARASAGGSTRDSSPGLLLDAMQDVETELARLMNEWSAAEGDLVRRTVQVERLAAPHRLKLKREHPSSKQGGPTKDDLDALVLDWLWEEHAELMDAQLTAEADCAAFRVIYKCADRALSSRQSRLNADLKLEPRRSQ
jgi:hypothetical protein